MDRRAFLCGAASLTLGAVVPLRSWALEPFDFAKFRTGYLERIRSFEKNGVLPILDIESSYNPLEIDLPAFTRSMDRAGVALMCMSADQPGKLVGQGQVWSDHAFDALEKYPTMFIPTGNGGNHPAWTKSPDAFMAENERRVIEHRYPMMGEFEMRHYPSPRQIQRGELFRDVDVSIDGPLGHRIFAFAEKTGITFQIHYEIEDRLLEPLERMLTKYPKAKVVWCHFAQIRYSSRSTRYSPAFLSDWLDRFPNLYVDTAFGDSLSTYRPSGERHARFWSQVREWSELIVAKPYRFLAALDIGGDRMNRVEEWTRTLRSFLETLPPQTREIVAYKAGWKLLFGEQL